MIETSIHESRLKKRQAELLQRRDKVMADLGQPGDLDLEDQATQRENDEVLEELNEAARNELAEIAAALDRIRLGTYGHCISCGNEIEAARLEAVPTATRCAKCAR